MNRIFILFSALLLSGCAPFVDVMDVNKVPREERNKAASVQIYKTGDNVRAKIIGPVEATSCKGLLTDPPPSQANATEQLKIKVLRMGGNVVTDFSCDGSGTDTFGTNCWASITCAGNAGLK